MINNWSRNSNTITLGGRKITSTANSYVVHLLLLITGWPRHKSKQTICIHFEPTGYVTRQLSTVNNEAITGVMDYLVRPIRWQWECVSEETEQNPLNARPTHLLAAILEHKNRARLFSWPLPQTSWIPPTICLFSSPPSLHLLSHLNGSRSQTTTTTNNNSGSSSSSLVAGSRPPRMRPWASPTGQRLTPLQDRSNQLGWNNKSASDPPVVDLEISASLDKHLSGACEKTTIADESVWNAHGRAATPPAPQKNPLTLSLKPDCLLWHQATNDFQIIAPLMPVCLLCVPPRKHKGQILVSVSCANSPMSSFNCWNCVETWHPQISARYSCN